MMTTGAERLAYRFAQSNAELFQLAQSYSDIQWQAVCAAEGWSVGATIYHIAADYLDLLAAVETLVHGRQPPMLTRKLLDERNARHVQDSAAYSREETVAFPGQNAERVTKAIRSLDDNQLAPSGGLLGREVTV